MTNVFFCPQCGNGKWVLCPRSEKKNKQIVLDTICTECELVVHFEPRTFTNEKK